MGETLFNFGLIWYPVLMSHGSHKHIGVMLLLEIKLPDWELSAYETTACFCNYRAASSQIPIFRVSTIFIERIYKNSETLYPNNNSKITTLEAKILQYDSYPKQSQLFFHLIYKFL